MNPDARQSFNTAAEMLKRITGCELSTAAQIIELIALGTIRWNNEVNEGNEKMALTTGGSVNVENAPAVNPQGTPNKNIVGAASAGPNTAKFPGVASDTSASGEVPDQSSGDTDSAAKAVYGTGPTRQSRVQTVGEQAAAASPDGGATNEGVAFIDGGGHSWSDV